MANDEEHIETPEAVADAPGGESTGADADSDLDTLLEEWERDMGSGSASTDDSDDKSTDGDSEPEQEKASGDSRVDELYAWAQGEEHQRQAEDQVRELGSTIEKARTELADLTNAPSDEMIEAFVLREYQFNKAFQEAFDNRHSDRDAWNRRRDRAINAYRTHIQENVPDAAATADRNAVTSAVHAARFKGVETDQPITASDIRKMSDSEFERLRRSMSNA